MTKRSDERYLADMLEYAEAAKQIGASATRERFESDVMVQFALKYAVQVIGEAASKLPEQSRVALPDLPWSRMIAMRHRLVHGYHATDLDLVWDVVTNRLDELVAALRRVLPADLQ